MSLSVENWRAAQRSAARAVYATITNHTSIVLYRANYNLRSGNWSAFPPGSLQFLSVCFFSRVLSVLSIALVHTIPETIQPNEIVDFGAHASGLMGGTTDLFLSCTRLSL